MLKSSSTKKEEDTRHLNRQCAPALAMDRMPGRSWRSVGLNSSSNSPPQMDSPPVPSPAGQQQQHSRTRQCLGFCIDRLAANQLDCLLCDL